MARDEKIVMSVVYDGITIGYDEDESVFRFILRGRNRKADSLKQAKDFIDKPVPEEVKKTPFEPVEAYYRSGYSYRSNDEFELVTVTSLAEDSKYNSVEAWIKDKSGSRSKVGIHSLYLKTDANFKVIQQMKALDKQEEDIRKQKEKALATVQKFEAVKEKVPA